MDAFEAIRESAARLHDELVSAGADARKALALAESAIRRLDLDCTG